MKKSGFQGIQLGKKRSEALLDFSVEVLVRLGMQFWGSFPVVAMRRGDLLLVKWTRFTELGEPMGMLGVVRLVGWVSHPFF